MDINKMKAAVKGITETGREFKDDLEFTMIPPAKGRNFYGTGYYMTVKTPSVIKLVDVRSERNIDVEILAERWIKNWYGKNAKDIRFMFE